MQSFNVAKLEGNPPFKSRLVKAKDARQAISIAFPSERETQFWTSVLSMRNPRYAVFHLSTDPNMIANGFSGMVQIFGARG